jgi:hypothetical protein
MIRQILKNVLLILTLTCDQAAEFMSRAQETALSRPERWALSFHLLICRLCRKYNRQLKLMRSIMNKIADPHTYEDKPPSLMEPEQSKAFQNRLSKKIRKNLDSM